MTSASETAVNRCHNCGQAWSGSHVCIHGEGDGSYVGQSVGIGPEGVRFHVGELKTDDKILFELQKIIGLLERILDEISV